MYAISCARPFHFSDSPPYIENSISATKSHSTFLRVSMHMSRTQHTSRLFLKSTRKESVTTESPQISDNKLSGSENTSSNSSSFLSVLCPLLKLFGGGDPSRERNDIIEVITSSLSSVARLPWGSKSLIGTVNSPESIGKPPKLQLYEFEACPFCRRVREAMTELDLSSEVYPCPKGSRRNRELVRKTGGKEQFPFLIDVNNGVSMYESGDIVRYLFQQYGLGRSPSFGLLESTPFTGWMPTILRAGRGMTLWDRAAIEPPLKMLELFSYENNPNARIVREALCELELPYVLHNVGEGSLNTELLVKVSGSKEVPYFVDPNTGTQSGDYKKILSYLFQTSSDYVLESYIQKIKLAQLLGFRNFIPPYSTVQRNEVLRGVNFASGAGGIRDETGNNLGEHYSFTNQVEHFRDVVQVLRRLFQRNDTKLCEHLSKGIFLIVMGSNDYLNNYFMPNYYTTSSDYSPKTYSAVLLEDYSRLLNQLYELGARKVVVSGLGEIGCIPYELARLSVSNNKTGSRCNEKINRAIKIFNIGLLQLVKRFNLEMEDAKFIYVNTYESMKDLVTNAMSYGFHVVDKGCCGVGRNNGQITCLPLQTPCTDRGGHLFWDAFHPTEAANQIYAMKAYNSTSAFDVYPMNIKQLALA